MSDFFRNLASRAVPDESGVRPRVAGRFEPSEPVAELAEINEEIASLADAAPVSADSRQRHQTSGMSGFETVAQPRRQAPPPPSAAASESPSPINPDVLDALQSNPPIPARSELTPADGGEAPTAMLPAMPLRMRDPDDEASPQQEERAIDKGEPPVQRPTVVSPAGAQAAPIGPAAAEPANAPMATAARHRPASGKLAPETVVARKPREMPTPADALPPPETVVHVTIGRVELRAPTAAAPRKRERAATQVTTLAEYLQKHAARNRS
jgi:hypothetical protein